MHLSSSRLVIRQAARATSHNAVVAPRRLALSTTAFVRLPVEGGAASCARGATGIASFTGAMALTIVTAAGLYTNTTATSTITSNAAKVPTSGDVVSMGTLTTEPQTGIKFPPLCNGLSLAGVGVRIKYVFVKVYAVGTYVDPKAMKAVNKSSKQSIEKALLDPSYPRTIRIVMNRGLSIDKYTAAIVESIEPRLQGRELETLDAFKKLNPQVDLIEGAEIEMTIRGDTLLYKNAVGGVGSLQSRLFCAALCDVYYGSDPVSPGHKDSVIEGIQKM